MRCEYMTDILFQAIDEIMESGVLRDRKIVMFGLNAPAFVCKQYLQDHGIEIFAFVDNKPSAVSQFNDPKITPTFHHLIGERRIVAYKPDELPQEFRGDYVFLLYSKFEKEMLEQLESLGYDLNSQAYVMGGFWKTEEIKSAYIPEDAGKQLSPEEIKEHQMAGLRYIHHLCEKHGLPYYLHFGSLLGAVRHKGYIPWDDDLDIAMMNEDMLKLLQIIREENGRYGTFYVGQDDPARAFIARLEDKETCYHQWDIPLETFGGQIALDIFPLIGMPEGEEERNAFYREVLGYAREYDDLTVEFPNPDEKTQERRLQCKRYVLDAMLKYPAAASDHVFMIPTKPGRPLIFDRNIWAEQIPMEFEGETFFGPSGYDAFLSQHYRNYMSPPPENRRVSIHRTTVFAKKR